MEFSSIEEHILCDLNIECIVDFEAEILAFVEGGFCDQCALRLSNDVK